ncbi:MAG: Ig-like domain-containing protein, partial [Nocardioidaceae bacterium]
NNPASEIGSASVEGAGQSAMTSQYLRDASGALIPGSPTLQQAVFAGTVNPRQIVAVREIKQGTGGEDTAVFSGPLANYTIAVAGGVTTVTDTTGTDGVDRLSNVERLQFADGVTLSVPAAPVIRTATAGNASATVRWTAPADNGSPVTGYEIVVSDGTVIRGIPSTDTSRVVSGLTNGTSYTFQVRATNVVGTGPLSAPSNSVIPAVPVGPQITSRTPDFDATGVAVTANVTAVFDRNMVPNGFTNSTVVLRGPNPTDAPVSAQVNYAGATRTVTLNPSNSLARNTKYTVTLTGGATAIRSAAAGGVASQPLTTTSWSFTTALAPTLTSTTPVSGATGVARGANILADFSESIVPAGVTATSVVLTNTLTGAVIPSARQLNNAGVRVTINPNNQLARNTQFTVTLVGGPTAIRAAAGGVPLGTTSWKFTTAP